MYSIDHGFENNNKRQIGPFKFQFIDSIYKKLNNMEDQTPYIYNSMSYILRNMKNKTKIISSHAIGILIPIGEIELPLLGFCRLLFSFPYIVFDSRMICKMITCNYFDSWKKDYNTHAIITRKFYVPGFHYPANFVMYIWLMN